MPAFRDFSVTIRLRLLSLAACGVGLIAACIISGGVAVIQLRQAAVNEMSSIAAIIAESIAEGLFFKNSKAAAKVLKTLEAYPSIQAASVFDPHNQVFAQYRAEVLALDPMPVPGTIEAPGWRFEQNALRVSQPILYSGERIGALLIQSQPQGIHGFVFRYSGYVFFVLGLAFLIMLFTLSRMKQALAAVFNSFQDQVREQDQALREFESRHGAAAAEARNMARETHRINLQLETEIAERMRTDKALRESENKYRGIFENAQEGIFRADSHNRFIDANPSMARILGYDSPQQLIDSVSNIGKQVFADRSEKRRFYEALSKEGRVSGFEGRFKRKDGKEIWGSVRAVTVYDQRRNPIYVDGLIEDISHRKAAEYALKEAYRHLEQRVEERTAELKAANEELRRAMDAADAASRAKTEFLASMSHEIRTPLHAVISAAELALSETMPPAVRRYLNIIHSSGSALMGIINDILDFSRIDAGRLSLERLPFRLEDTVDKIIQRFAGAAFDKGIELVIEVLPQTPTALIGDPVRFQQVLANLVDNAVKFTEKDGVICVIIGYERESENTVRLNCRVMDTGIGMTENQVASLFQAFTPGDASTTRRFGGIGLGLCISRHLVDMMQGGIQAKSEPGKGSEFIFSVVMGLQAEPRQALGLPENLRGMRAIVADDCAASREAVCRMLAALGFEPVAADSGESAIALLKNKEGADNFELALLDMSMPVKTGMETAGAIRADLKLRLPVILMGKPVERAAFADISKGVADRFIEKPVTVFSLSSLVREIFKVKTGFGDEPAAGSAQAPQPLRSSLKGARILVVDDSPVNREILEEILSLEGVIVRCAADGEEAVDLVFAESFDAVLMDIRMPRMDGHEATRRIRKDGRFHALPIIAMTGDASESEAEKCIRSGMNLVAVKPIRREELFSVLMGQLCSNPIEGFAVQAGQPRKADMEGRVQTADAFLRERGLFGLNIKQAMQNLGIGFEAYTRILERFVQQNAHAVERINAHAAEGECFKLQSQAHSLRGSSANIGALNLAAAAQDVENLCRDTNGAAFESAAITPLLDRLEKQWQETVAAITALNAFKPETRPHPVLSSEDPGRLLTRLYHALTKADPERISFCLKQVKNSVSEPLIAPIENKINEYEYDEAIEAVLRVSKEIGVPLLPAEIK